MGILWFIVGMMFAFGIVYLCAFVFNLGRKEGKKESEDSNSEVN